MSRTGHYNRSLMGDAAIVSQTNDQWLANTTRVKLSIFLQDSKPAFKCFTALIRCQLFPHHTNNYSTGNSNTLFIINFETPLFT